MSQKKVIRDSPFWSVGYKKPVGPLAEAMCSAPADNDYDYRLLLSPEARANLEAHEAEKKAKVKIVRKP